MFFNALTGFHGFWGFVGSGSKRVFFNRTLDRSFPGLVVFRDLGFGLFPYWI